MWWIGLTYFLTAAVIPFIISYVVAGLLTGTLGSEYPGEIALVLGSLITLVLLWPGVRYSANYIRKKYPVVSMREVALWGLVFYAFGAGSSGIGIEDTGSVYFYLILALPIVEMVTFFSLSKKYLIRKGSEKNAA